MGEILLRTGIAYRAIDAIDQAIQRVPGRLSVVAVTGGTVFSALSGSTIATTAMLGQALVPDMLRRGYHPTMAVGPIIAIGGVDMLIPPSNLAVIFATIASSLSIVKVSVAELLIAGHAAGADHERGLYRLTSWSAAGGIRNWRRPGGTEDARAGQPLDAAADAHPAAAVHFHRDDGQHVFRLGFAVRIRRGRLPRNPRAGSGLPRFDMVDPARRFARHRRA